MSQKNKWELNHLIKNLKGNKDAVIIIGNKAVKELELYPIDEASKKMLNKKKMVKEPKYFWKHYRENISLDKGISKAEEELNLLLNSGAIKTVVNLNYTGAITPVIGSITNLIELKGHKNVARCMTCDKVHVLTDNMLNTLSLLKCDCKGKIAPSIVMYGEKYLQKNTEAIKNAIFIEEDNEVKLNTHCLIFIGVDFEEDYLHDLIESYSAIKSKVTTDEEPYFLVMITQGDWASVEFYQPEFATNEDIPGSISRLTAQLKEG